MKLREVVGPRDCAARAMNAQVDLVVEALRENEKRQVRFQEPLKIPEFNVKKMIKDTEELVAKAFAARQEAYGDGWFGNLERWHWEAMQTLKKDLKAYARRTNDENLMRQIEEAWPETKPPRPLTPEELKELEKIQTEADKAADDLMSVVKAGLEQMWEFAKEEYDILRDTNSQDQRRIYTLVGWFAKSLTAYIDGWWRFKRGGSTTSPERVEQEVERERPKRWVK